jgi:hypothetical protein
MLFMALGTFNLGFKANKNSSSALLVHTPPYREDHKVVPLGANKKTFFVIARFSKI